MYVHVQTYLTYPYFTSGTMNLNYSKIHCLNTFTSSKYHVLNKLVVKGMGLFAVESPCIHNIIFCLSLFVRWFSAVYALITSTQAWCVWALVVYI